MLLELYFVRQLKQLLLVAAVFLLGTYSAAFGQDVQAADRTAAQSPAAVPASAVPAAAVPASAVPAASRSRLGGGSNSPWTLSGLFHDWAVETAGPHAIVLPALTSALRLARPRKAYPLEWREGGGAFGRNYGAALATHGARETGRFITAAVFHEDYRYRASESSNPVARLAHAIGYTFVDRSASGHRQIALSNFAGAAAGGFAGELYLPPGFNNANHAETKMALELAGMAGRNVLREFAPDIARMVHIPATRFPEWWTHWKRK